MRDGAPDNRFGSRPQAGLARGDGAAPGALGGAAPRRAARGAPEAVGSGDPGFGDVGPGETGLDEAWLGDLSLGDLAGGGIDLGAALARLGDGRGRLSLDPERVEQDLARLVLGLIELLRRLMEAQAIRRMEAGTLTPAQEERLGDTLMRAAGRVRELAAAFGLSEADLSLDLGPLGRTV